MTYDAFVSEIISVIRNTFSEEDINITLNDAVLINRNTQVMNIYTKTNEYGITYYPEEWYDSYVNGDDFNEISERVIASIYLNYNKELKIPSFSKEEANYSIRPSIVNTEKNQALLMKCPHKKLADLSIILRWNIPNFGSFTVDSKLLENINMDVEEAFEIGWKNLESESFIIDNLYDFCMGLSDISDLSEIMDTNNSSPKKVFIITSADLIDGSRAILSKSFMHKVSETLCCDMFVVVPSSRHELLLICIDSFDEIDSLRSIVREINNKYIDKRDFLSDEVYFYNSTEHELEIIEV